MPTRYQVVCYVLVNDSHVHCMLIMCQALYELLYMHFIFTQTHEEHLIL